MDDFLNVWLNGVHVAALTSDGPGGGASLTYTPEAIERWGLGFPLLSVRLPVSGDRYPATMTRAFIDGLLPEDHIRALLADKARVATDDSYGLLRAYGMDCAGAIQVLDAESEAAARNGTIRWLNETELADAVADLPSAPLGVSVTPGVRSSLGGLQGKLVVVVDGGRIGLPLNGQPSTHILKPARLTEKGQERWPGIAQLETWGLRLIRAAHAAGVSANAAGARVINISGRPAILVKRFDREINAAGDVQRIHQEDFAQALGIKEKYQRDDSTPPRLIDTAALLASHATTPAQSLIELLELVTINAAIGNCDMHARNLALLHRDGKIGLTPAYDVVPTAVWSDHDRELALRIGDEAFLDDLRGVHLEREAVSWGMRRPVAKRTIKRTLDILTQELPGVRQVAVEEGWDHPMLDVATSDALARVELLRFQ
ncbi:serine/threonine-protein kinase HipA [Arthrobacter silviterrae]|uniref:Type II toxin-antitoxin system HipA family toxin n=1 Tax=Arthrobacter silviterrae TaxID=2026658 RepID=A0ABX0DA03_9MICC|nr:HipA domain-containing protein [Arthrobacter silviterrae]MDQ0278580.1 serine/threonine-protein kinase HipA [Arthrobacter silviterrae]NGN82164.1 type II toxin-antitoxin system HipA family toxin [Arthrobacter silviterrae]